MSEGYLVQGTQRAGKVDQLFTSIARRYDLINDVQSFGLHRRWKKRMVRMCELKAGDMALDICCGTGDITFQLAGQGARATGVDFNEAMLRVALQRAAGTGCSFLQGDALKLPFTDNRFDVVTVGYGLRNLSSLRAGLEEILRVLKPGGRFVALDFGKPDQALWRGIYFGYLRAVVPIFGKLFAGDFAAYAYILDSLRIYPAQRGVAAELEKLGYTNNQIVNLMGGAMSLNVARKAVS